MEKTNQEKQKTNRWVIYMTYISTFITIISLILTCYFYLKTKVEREPVFVVDPVKTEIINSNNISNAPIIVTKKNGEQIKSDLVSIRFYFWNMGRKSIKKENILDKIVIRIEDKNSQILDYRILKKTRDITGIKIKPSNSKNEIVLDFDILEKDDGAACQLIYQGKSNSKINIYGYIEGVERIKEIDEIKKKSTFYNLPKYFFIWTILFVLMIITNKIMNRLEKFILNIIFKKFPKLWNIRQGLNNKFKKLKKIDKDIDAYIVTYLLVLIFCYITARMNSMDSAIPNTILPTKSN